jgi:hypothetical protein
MGEQAVTDSRWHTQPGSLVAALLAEIATPDLYRRNPFRVLGLPITATTRAIATQVQKLVVLAELGSTDPALAGPFPLNPPPSLEDIRRAEKELHDPTRRIIHEFFWFWPLDGADGAKDTSFLALKAGDVATASRIWSESASDATKGPLALHNTAVRWHLTALGMEKQSAKVLEDKDAKERYVRYWKGAIKLLDQALSEGATWSALSARALAAEDDRISLEFIQELRAGIPRAIGDINATLVARYASAGQEPLAKLQMAVLLNEPFHALSPTEFATTAISALKTSLRTFLRANDPGVAGHEEAAANLAERLIAGVGPYFACFEDLAAPAADDDTWRVTVDEGLRIANRYAVAYVQKTADHTRFIGLLVRAMPLASSPDLQRVIRDNRSGALEEIAGAYLTPHFAVLKEVSESRDAPKARLESLRTRLLPGVPGIHKKLDEIGYPQDQFNNSVAFVLRGISVDAWNQKQDEETSAAALDLADQFAADPELAETLRADRATLHQVVSTRDQAKKARRDSLVRRGIAAVLVIGFLVYLANMDDSGHSSAPAPTAQSAQPSTPEATTGPTDASDALATPSIGGGGSPGTYIVPHRYEAELVQDREEADRAQALTATMNRKVEAADREVRAKQAAMQSLSSQADALSASIEAQRPLVQGDDSAEVDAFNAQVHRYNAIIIRLRRMNTEVNQQIADYNEMLGRARAQMKRSDSLIDAYNAKLERYGHRQ